MSFHSNDSDTQDSSGPNKNSKLYTFAVYHRHRIVDLAFIGLIIVMIAYYLIINSIFPVPIRDGIVFMINAHEWLNNTELLEIYRPPLFSWVIDIIWVINGEDWTVIKYVQIAFTIVSVILLYILLRKRKGALFAFGVSTLTFTNLQLFFYTSQILTEGISLFFLILTLYFFEGTKKVHWVFSGISIALTFASRYPILLQSLVIFAVESITRKNPKSVAIGTISFIIVILLVIGIVYLKTGTFQMALEKDSSFGKSLSSFYIVNAIDIWGPAIILIPIAFVFKSTFKDKFNYIFIAWFFISLLSWSTNSSNYQYRFTIQFMPATYFLVILAVENLVKFDRNNLIFLNILKR